MKPKPQQVECKYHVVFIPKCRRKTLYGELKTDLGDVFRKLALQKESRVEEGHLTLDHVHMMISIHQNIVLASGRIIKGKSAIHLARCLWGEEAQLCRAALLGQRVLRPQR